MLSDIPGPITSRVQRTIFYANSTAAGNGWQTYNVPRNVSMISIFLLAGGGGGGTGGTGTSPRGGGGGGGSSGQTTVTVPAALLPSTLFLSIGYGGAAATAGIASRISVFPNTTANHCLAIANAGGAGGSPTTGNGAGGTAGGVATIATMPLATLGFFTFLAGQGGSQGNAATAGAALTIPTTGLVVTGGTGGGGLPAGSVAGTAGGAFTVPAGGFFPPQPGGIAPVVGSPTTSAGIGSNGINFINGLNYFYGGTGSSSTHGAATGDGLIKANGGNGGFGCGGGGSGGGLTNATPLPEVGFGGRGGDGLAIIYAW
jgi:hypothetical protein